MSLGTSNQVYASGSYPLAVPYTGTNMVSFNKLSAPPIAFLDRGILYELNDGVLYYNGSPVITGASGYVEGPGASTNNAIMAWDGTDGDLAKNTTVILKTSATTNLGMGSANTLSAITSGDNNLALGFSTLTAATSGSGNLALGAGACQAVTTGSNNVGLGLSALNVVTTGTGNVAIGKSTLDALTTGSSNIAIGTDALGGATTSSSSIAVGAGALFAQTTAIQNIGVGVSALAAVTTGGSNTAVGHQSMAFTAVGVTQNVAVGHSTLTTNQGNLNTAVGFEALKVNTTGTHNTSIGAKTMTATTTGGENTVVGYNALNASTTGGSNTVVGSANMVLTPAPAANTSVGYNILAANANATCQENVLIGHDIAPTQNASFTSNVMIGGFAGSVVSGACTANVIVGANAAANATTLNNCIMIGGVTTTTSGTDSIVIGNVGSATESGNIRIGTAATHTKAFISGIRGVTTTNADAVAVLVDSAGQLGTVSSSIKYKTNLEPLSTKVDSSIIYQLKPMAFNYKADNEQGFSDHVSWGLIAEDVEKVCPEMCIYEKKETQVPIAKSAEELEREELLAKLEGKEKDDRDDTEYSHPTDDKKEEFETVVIKELYTVDYARLPILLLDQVQKLKAENQALRADVDVLKQAVKAFLKIGDGQ